MVDGKAKLLRDDYCDGANLLVSADSVAYAYANFHEKFMHNRVTLIGCPKLDAGDYSEKLIPWQVITISTDGKVLEN